MCILEETLFTKTHIFSVIYLTYNSATLVFNWKTNQTLFPKAWYIFSIYTRTSNVKTMCRCELKKIAFVSLF